MVICVTGFGPFRDFMDKNPSWEAVKLIPGLNMDSELEFIIREIPVTYKDVEDKTKELWTEYNPELMVHVGVSALASKVTIESQANRIGYCMPDCIGQTHPTGAACPKGMDTICCALDLKAVCKEVNNNYQKIVACTSSNAGRYLCEYIYYKSLSMNSQRTIFVHVPQLNHTVKMIPPLAPLHTDECQNMVGWKNTFNMRQVTLMNLAAHHLSLKGNNQSRHVITCMQNGCINSPVKSLDLLRKNIQNAINKDIDNVIRKYIEKFFQPAVNNIRNNCGKDSVNEEHIKEACCKILEEAKSMYSNSLRSRDSSPYDYSDSETGSLVDYKFGRPITGSPLFRKRKESDTDSETSHTIRKKTKPKLGLDVPPLTRLPVKRDGPKWNSDRVTQNTLFIMGAKANKVLGFGQTRGRLYVRHPDLVRYSGDHEDKEWLAQQSLMPPTGGKAYLMILDDIRELSQTDEYKNHPNLQLQELKGFEVPNFMLNKIKTYIENSRTDKVSIDLFDFHSQTPPSAALDSGPSTPSDTFSKQSENCGNFVQIPEVSPGSNHSFLSGALTQSPLSNSRVTMSVSPHLLVSFQQQQHAEESSQSLSNLLATHISNEEHDHD